MVARSVAVRLTAEVSSYIANMTRAGAATRRAMGVSSAAVARNNAAMARGERAHRALVGTAKLGAVAVVGGFALAAKAAADFEEKMALVQTLAHANRREMVGLSHSARTVGTAFGYTATEVADGEAEMVKAGISLRDIMGGGLKGALALAAAGQTDVATATTIAAAAMTEFRLKGKDIPHVADLLAAGADKALGTVTDLGYGLSQAGTTSHQFGISIEETVGSLAAFAQAGLIGERGGTTFKQMLLQLASPTKKAQGLMDKFDLSLYHANGTIKTMPELADNLSRSFKGVDPAARNAALGVIFGTRAIQGANIMMAEGRDGIAKWIRKVNDQGFAAQQARGKLDSLKGDLQKLKAEGFNALIDLGTGSQSPLRKIVQDLTQGIHNLTVDGSLKRWGNESAQALQTIVDGAKPVLGAIGSVISAFNSLPTPVKTGLATAGFASVALRRLPGGKAVTRSAASAVTGGLAGRSGVVPVFVTNMGKGTDGKPSEGLGKSAAPGLAAGASRNPYGALAVGLGIAGYQFGKFNYGDKPLTQPKNAIGGGKVGDWARGLNLSGIKLPSGKDFLGMKVNIDGATKSLGGFWGTLKKAASGDAFGRLGKGAKDAGDKIKHASWTGKDELDQLPFKADQAGVSTRQLSRMFNTLPSQVITKFLTPGAVESKKDVRALGRQFGLTPKQVTTLMKLLGIKEADDKIHHHKKELDGINAAHAHPKVSPNDADFTPKIKKHRKELDGVNAAHAHPKVTVDGGQATSTIGNVRGQLSSLDGKRADSYIYLHHITVNSVRGAPGGGVKRDKYGNAIADGGLFVGSTRKMDTGGYTDTGQYVPRVPQMRQGGGNVLWSEPVTGWEAYISGKPGMEERNRTILAMAAGRLGMNVNARADGGIDDLHYRHNIRGVTHELRKLTAQLKKDQEERKQYRNTVRDAFKGDPFQGTLGGFDAQVAHERRDIQRTRANLSTLRSRGLSGRLYRDLAASGNVSLISQFAGLTRAQIAARERAFGARNRGALALGEQASGAVFGKEMRNLRGELRDLRHELHALRHGHHIGNTNIRHAVIKDSDKKNKTKVAAKNARHGR